tara:strand:- start:211 stop:411 length:201 start_codon:yes stop_codon:yes gene_type:complete
MLIKSAWYAAEEVCRAYTDLKEYAYGFKRICIGLFVIWVIANKNECEEDDIYNNYKNDCKQRNTRK